MAQIAANPWFFSGTADQASTVGITSITNNTASILVTTTAAHGFVNNYTPVSIQGTVSYNGPYRILAIPSTTTLLLLNRLQNYTAAAGGAAGNLLSMAYIGGHVRAEQIYWQANVTTDTLLLTDGFGNTIWNPKTTQGATGFGPYSYGKVYWFQNGLVINTLLASNTVQITVN